MWLPSRRLTRLYLDKRTIYSYYFQYTWIDYSWNLSIFEADYAYFNDMKMQILLFTVFTLKWILILLIKFDFC